MGDKSLDELVLDPSLATLAGKPTFTRVSAHIAARLLCISRSTLGDFSTLLATDTATDEWLFALLPP